MEQRDQSNIMGSKKVVWSAGSVSVVSAEAAFSNDSLLPVRKSSAQFGNGMEGS